MATLLLLCWTAASDRGSNTACIQQNNQLQQFSENHPLLDVSLTNHPVLQYCNTVRDAVSHYCVFWRPLTPTAFPPSSQAMYAPSTNFFGDIQQHQSVACTLGELLDIAAQQQQQQGEAAAAGGTSAGQTAAAAAEQAAVEQPITGATAASSEGFAAMHLYLAQQSLFCPGRLQSIKSRRKIYQHT